MNREIEIPEILTIKGALKVKRIQRVVYYLFGMLVAFGTGFGVAKAVGKGN